MLRQDVVDACAAGRFHVFGVSHVSEALALLTGRDSGFDESGVYVDGTVLGEAMTAAKRLWNATKG